MNEPISHFAYKETLPLYKTVSRHITTSYSVEVSSIKTTGLIPCCRSSFIGVLYNNSQIFIHGGTTEDIDLHDSYILDIETMVWNCYAININYKLTLVGHTALMIRNEEQKQHNLLIFGGWDGSKYIDICYLLNLESNTLKVSYYKGWNNTSNSVKFKQHSSKGNIGNARNDKKYFK